MVCVGSGPPTATDEWFSGFPEEDRDNNMDWHAANKVFPCTGIPRIHFDGKPPGAERAERIFIADTTFRDGQQARAPYNLEQIGAIFDLLHRLSGPQGIIRQTEFFVYTKRDRLALEFCMAKGYLYPVPTGWIRASHQDLGLLSEVGLQRTAILTSVSDYQIFLKLKANRKTALDMYLSVVRSALDKGIVPTCSFEDITRSDVYGFCVPFALELMRLREESRVDISIRLCDTLGLGVPYPGSALPRSVPGIARALIDDAGVPGRLLQWHGHNDFHKALVNAVTAWLHGCAGASGTLFGLGERTGNTPIEALVMEYIGIKGTAEGMDTTAIADMARYFEEELGYDFPAHYPLVGRNSACAIRMAG
jgi:isopropylmalate/homocitrate/citramalate synthase